MPPKRFSPADFGRSHQEPSSRAETYCASLFEGAITATNSDERELFVGLLLRYLEWVFRVADPLPPEFDYTRGACGGFIFLHKALANPATHDACWRWTRSLIGRAATNESFQDAIAVGVFELIARFPLEFNKPPEAELIDRFLRCYEEPESRWLVHRSYSFCARKLEHDLHSHALWCESVGRPPVEFKLFEICAWILEQPEPNDDEDDEDDDDDEI